MNYAPVMMRRLVYDKPGRYEFQPGHYPGAKYVQVFLTPASEAPGRVVVEVWGYPGEQVRVRRIHRVMSMVHRLMRRMKGIV